MTRLAPAIVRLLERPEAERRLGSFFLVEPLGHGGFAPVWLAKERVGSAELRTAAVKLFPLDGVSEGSGDAESAGRKRTVEEARALCKVEHPNVVKFYTLCLDEAIGVLGLAMEHLAGTNLNNRIAAVGRLSVDETIRVGIAIASALSAVHRAKLVHRDVKPSNIVEAAGVYKLIDFGIAAAEALNAPEPPRREPRDGDPDADAQVSASGRELPGGDATVRVIGFQSGTQGYIDPVCFATGAPASSGSDLYALGATLFECLTGMVPAAAAVAGTGQRSVLGGRAAPPALQSLVPEVPAALAHLVDSMVAPLRHTRPPSAEWVAQRLEEIRLERQAEAAWAELERMGPEAAKTARVVLLALTTPEGTRTTRTVEEITAFAGAETALVIDSLSSAGILAAGGQRVTLTDDRLITHWGRLREWLEATREDRLLAEELERDAKRRLVDVDVPLWQKRRLASAENLWRRGDLYISAGAIAFLQASRRAERRVRMGITVVAAVVALGVAFTYWKTTVAQEISNGSAAVYAVENPPPVVVVEKPGGKPSADATAQPAETKTPPAHETDTSVGTTKTDAGKTTKSTHTPRPAGPSTPAPPPAEHEPPPTTPSDRPRDVVQEPTPSSGPAAEENLDAGVNPSDVFE